MEKIAVVGMSCILPGGNDYQMFWDVLKSGKDCIQEIDIERWGKNYKETNSSSKWCGSIQNPFSFDNQFFGISPKEAKNMDPQQRLLLEETYHAIEDTGESLEFFSNKTTSVFVACMNTDYRENVSFSNEIGAYSASGVFDCMLANRLSYMFNLTGRSEIVNVACASSLVAIHNACNSIRSGESDVAIVGAVNLNLNPFKYESFSQAHMLSPDGKCKTFDSKANGYVPGDGIAVIVLERLSEAKINNHNIYGVVLGSKVAHSGKTVSLTAPSIESQEKLLSSTWKSIGLNVDNLTYIETHGTGTSLGDPIEVEAIKKAFRNTAKKNKCFISSVKLNIGHLEACAGMAGIIKILLMMKHRMIPPTINLNRPNPIINFDKSNLVINEKLIEWKPSDGYSNLVAGVSSFGFGGAISHVVLESYEDSKKTHIISNLSKKQVVPFLLSAKTKESMSRLVEEWSELLNNPLENFDIFNYSYTLLRRPKIGDYKLGFTYSSKDELIHNINKYVKTNFNNVIHESNYSVWLPNDINDVLHNYLFDSNILYNHFYKYFLNEIEKLPYNNLDQLDINLIRLLAFGKCLLTICKSIKSIGGNGNGKLVSIILSGIITLPELITNIKAGTPLQNIKIPNLKLNLSKDIQMDSIYSFSLYFKKLLENNENESINYWFLIFKEDYKLLVNTQFTFKNNLKIWKPVFDKFDINFEEIASENIDIEKYSANQKLLIILSISYSWKKLNQKWGISIEDIPHKFVHEISELLISEKLDKSFVADFLLSTNNSPQVTPGNFELFCMSLTESELVYLPELRTVSLEIWRIFLKKHVVSLEVSFPKETIQIIDYLNFDNSESLMEKDQKWINFLIQLWLKGNTVDFGKYLGCGLVKVPQYPFIKTDYLANVTNYHVEDTINSNYIQNKEVINDKGSIQWLASDQVIADHIINGHLLVPGSLILFKVLENKGIYKHISGSITFLSPFILIKGELSTKLYFDQLSFKWTKKNKILSSGIININKNIKLETIQYNTFNSQNIIKNSTDIYKFFYKKGYHFGEGLKSIHSFWEGIKCYHAKILVPQKIQKGDLYSQRSILLDSIFQASILAGYDKFEELFANNSKSMMIVPFYIKNFNILSDLLNATQIIIRNLRLIKTVLEVDAIVLNSNETIAEFKNMGFTWMIKN